MPDDRGEGPLVPILVDGTGRDGTTLLMQLLGTAAEIAFDRTYPYEQRYFSYLLQWSRLPLLEDWDSEDWSLDSLAHTEHLQATTVVGPIPWPERSLLAGSGEREFWEEAFEDAWASFSRRAREAVRTRLGDQKLELRYYAQKIAESWALPADLLAGARLLCILRDPRDTWMSSLAFHRRREAVGDAFLPLGPDETTDDFLHKFVEDQRKRMRWLRKVESEGVPVVRYEGLAGDLVAEAERLSEWLGVRLDAEAVLRRRGDYEQHMTAGGVEQSVGRWRGEMDEDVAALFRQAMGEELTAFGYEL